MTEPLLSVQDLRTYFHTERGVAQAVDGVELTIDRGQVVSLVGESGCGKSVTAMSILGLVDAAGEIMAGSSIVFDGRELTKLTAKEMRGVRGRDIGIVFQEPMSSLDPVYTVGFQITESIHAHQDISKADALERAVELMALVGISSPRRRLSSYPHEMSGGMRQRVMIAAALSCNPRLLIADEPTTALDVTIQAQILELLENLRERLNMAILLITHDMGVVAKISDAVSVMYAGKVVESGPVAEVLMRPRHPYTEALIQSIPKLGMDKRTALRVIPGIVPNPFEWPAGCRFADRCSYVFDRCRQEEPPPVEPGGVSASCWLTSDGGRLPAIRSSK